MKLLVLVVTSFPMLAFLLAGIMELRSDRNPSTKALGLAPVVLGMAVFGFFVYPDLLPHATRSSPEAVGRIMELVSAIVASSGAFVRYSRWASSILMALGGLALLFFWMFFSVPIV